MLPAIYLGRCSRPIYPHNSTIFKTTQSTFMAYSRLPINCSTTKPPRLDLSHTRTPPFEKIFIKIVQCPIFINYSLIRQLLIDPKKQQTVSSQSAAVSILPHLSQGCPVLYASVCWIFFISASYILLRQVSYSLRATC
jgi:hypothetical protein